MDRRYWGKSVISLWSTSKSFFATLVSSLLVVTVDLAIAAPPALPNQQIAQITPDATLGSERSSVTATPGRIRLEGGATRGAALFHSFSDFNVEAGQQVYFVNPDSITNILTRVTGTEASNILGTLGVEGAANLFLLNPIGISFGEDAQLDISGSFAATTAESLRIAGTEFSAVTPEAIPLLIVSVSPGIQYGTSRAQSIIENQASLAVDNQQIVLNGGSIQHMGQIISNGGAITLSASGDISTGLLDSRSATGAGGDIEVRSESGAISTTDSLLADGTLQAGNISLSADDDINVNGALTASSLGPAGDIALTAGGDIDLQTPGPVTRLGDIDSSGSQSGLISITSGGRITTDDIRIANRISGDGVGGDIRFSGEAIEFNRTSITSRTRDESQASLGFEQDAISGNVIVDAAADITLSNTNLFTSADFGSGNAGDVTVNAQRLQIVTRPDFVFPFSSAFGIFAYGDVESTGDGGNIVINASESVEIVGIDSEPFVPSINQAQAEASVTELVTTGTSIFAPAFGGGKAGSIQLSTGRLSIRDGAGLITTAVFDDGGDISIVADEIDLQGFALISSGTGLTGDDAGNLDIQAGQVSLTDGAVISASSFGPGNSGTLSLAVQQLDVQNGSSISTSAFDAGDGGRLSIRADDSVSVSGATADGSFASTIASNSQGAGNAGPLSIETGALFVGDRATILTATLGSGAGADIQIDTNTLRVDNGRIDASTTTAQAGGDIRINAKDSVEISGTGFDALNQEIIGSSFNGTLSPGSFSQGITTVTNSDGNAGSLRIETSEFLARGGAFISTTTAGQGAGGNIDIVAEDDLRLESMLLATGTFSDAPSGDINLQTRRLRASGGAQAITTTFGSGRAGNLTVFAAESIDLVDPTNLGIASGLLASSFQTAAGTGGDILVDTGDFRILDRATVSVSGEGDGNAGNIDIGARSLLLNRGFITATSASGEGGNIRLRIDDVMSMRNGSEISTTAGQAGAGGDGGNITFSDGLILAVPRENSDITANAFEGQGGNISITTQGLFGTEFRDNLSPLSDITASSETGLDGEVQIELLQPDLQAASVELPAQVESNNRVVARCGTLENEENTLVVTGRGGLPTDPRQLLQGETILQDVRDAETSSNISIVFFSTNALSVPNVRAEASNPFRIVEAQGWEVDEQGRVQLVAMSERTPHAAVACITEQRAGS